MRYFIYRFLSPFNYNFSFTEQKMVVITQIFAKKKQVISEVDLCSGQAWYIYNSPTSESYNIAFRCPYKHAVLCYG